MLNLLSRRSVGSDPGRIAEQELILQTVKRFHGRLAELLCTCILLGACSSNVVVRPPADFPQPLVEPLPLRLGVHYSDEFRNYSYQRPGRQTNEKRNRQSKLTIDIGEAQTRLMETVFNGLFASVKPVDVESLGQPSDDFDIMLVPEVVDFQFSTPRITKVNVYEIWIKYRFTFQAADGEEIASWVLPVYGKTPTKFLKSKEQAINLATLVALRDCGAAFITGFGKVPQIRDWLAKQLAPARASNVTQ